MDLKPLIIEAWNNRELLKEPKYADAVRAVIEEVDKGRLRTAAPHRKRLAGERVGEAGNINVFRYTAYADLEHRSFRILR